MNTNWYKIAKLSDYQGLLEQAITKLDNVIDKVYPNGSFSLYFQDLNNKKTKISVRLGENLQSEIDPQNPMHYKIRINTADNSKDEVYRTLAHEITHISQRYNGFSRYEFEELQKDYDKLKEKGINPNWNLIRDLRHDLSKTEHEAKLIGVLTLLKRSNIELAAKALWTEPEYYHFDNKKFLQSIYSFGIPIASYREVRDMINKEMDYRISLYHSNKYPLESLQDFVRSMKPVLNMLNLNRNDIIDFIIKEINNPNIPKAKNYRWNLIKEKLLETSKIQKALYKIAQNTKYPIINKLLPYIKQAQINGQDKEELINVLNGQVNNKFFVQKINNAPTSYESNKNKLITLLKMIVDIFPNLNIVKYWHQSIEGYSQEGYFIVNKNSFDSLLNALKISATQGTTPQYHEIMGEIYGYNEKEIKEFINNQEKPEKLNQTQIKKPIFIIQDMRTNQSQKII